MGNAPRSLPVLRPIHPLSLGWFDLTRSGPIALGVLRERVPGRVGSTVLGTVRRAVLADPTATLGLDRSRDEVLTRMQLRSVLCLAAALEEDAGLPRDEAREVVRAVMRASGAAFLLAFFGGFDADVYAGASPEVRDAFAAGLASRIFNAEVEALAASPEGLSFEVSRCRFADALATVGRSDLGPLFCEVDAALVERPDVPLDLHRTGTIATGSGRCDFRFTRRV